MMIWKDKRVGAMCVLQIIPAEEGKGYLSLSQTRISGGKNK
jgi:hypothetical protein